MPQKIHTKSDSTNGASMPTAAMLCAAFKKTER